MERFGGGAKPTNLKGYDDSALLVGYTNAQNAPRILLIYNDGRRLQNGAFADSGNTRQSLGLYALENVSDLGFDLAQGAEILAFDNAKFSTHFAFLQNIDSISVAHPNEVSYPSAVISDEWLFVAYTHNRKNIKIMRFDLTHLEAQIAQIVDLPLQGNFRNGESTKIIHKNKMDCHDFAKPNLAMTGKVSANPKGAIK